MKKIMTSICLISTITLLTSCRPGPVTFGNTTPIVSPTGKTVNVSYHASHKRIVSVPAGLKGSDLISSKINAVYASDPMLSPYHLTASTSHAMVKIVGTVPNQAVKKYAIKVARQAKGVLAVNGKSLVVGQ